MHTMWVLKLRKELNFKWSNSVEINGSLTGIKVLDLSRLLPGPYCSMILADHGAEVISIEDQRFKDDGLFFNSLYRNKKHLSLNLKSEEGKRIFSSLAEDADVILEGFRPGVAERLGVDFKTIHSRFPRIVYCSISGYGQDGPWKAKAGHDVNYLSSAGILDLIGPKNGPPTIPGVQIGDIGGGSMNALIGILLALLARNNTNKGQYIDISMTDGLLGLLSLPHFFHDNLGEKPQRSNNLLSHRYGCYNVYETADGRYMSVGAVENRFWKKLCELLGLKEYTDLQYVDEKQEEIISSLRRIFKTRSGVEWEAFFKDFDVCCTRVLGFEEIWKHPLFKERQMVIDWTEPDKTNTRMLGVAVKLSDTPGSIRTSPASFGQHNQEILHTLGYTREQIEDFEVRKII